MWVPAVGGDPVFCESANVITTSAAVIKY
jgi:hypothetical protein